MRLNTKRYYCKGCGSPLGERQRELCERPECRERLRHENYQPIYAQVRQDEGRTPTMLFAVEAARDIDNRAKRFTQSPSFGAPTEDGYGADYSTVDGHHFVSAPAPKPSKPAERKTCKKYGSTISVAGAHVCAGALPLKAGDPVVIDAPGNYYHQFRGRIVTIEARGGRNGAMVEIDGMVVAYWFRRSALKQASPSPKPEEDPKCTWETCHLEAKYMRHGGLYCEEHYIKAGRCEACNDVPATVTRPHPRRVRSLVALCVECAKLHDSGTEKLEHVPRFTRGQAVQIKHDARVTARFLLRRGIVTDVQGRYVHVMCSEPQDSITLREEDLQTLP